jgi:hypothetical protein
MEYSIENRKWKIENRMKHQNMDTHHSQLPIKQIIIIIIMQQEPKLKRLPRRPGLVWPGLAVAHMGYGHMSAHLLSLHTKHETCTRTQYLLIVRVWNKNINTETETETQTQRKVEGEMEKFS